MALQVSTADFSCHFFPNMSAFWARCLLSCNAQFPLGDSAISLKAILPLPDVPAGLPNPPLDVSADTFRASDVWFAETSARCLCWQMCFYQLLSLSKISPWSPFKVILVLHCWVYLQRLFQDSKRCRCRQPGSRSSLKFRQMSLHVMSVYCYIHMGSYLQRWTRKYWKLKNVTLFLYIKTFPANFVLVPMYLSFWNAGKIRLMRSLSAANFYQGQQPRR